jgi:hypothetical protein
MSGVADSALVTVDGVALLETRPTEEMAPPRTSRATQLRVSAHRRSR